MVHCRANVNRLNRTVHHSHKKTGVLYHLENELVDSVNRFIPWLVTSHMHPLPYMPSHILQDGPLLYLYGAYETPFVKV